MLRERAEALYETLKTIRTKTQDAIKELAQETPLSPEIVALIKHCAGIAEHANSAAVTYEREKMTESLLK